MFHLLCDFGEEVSTSFSLLGAAIFNVSWHLFPMAQQKYIILMTAMAAKPILMGGFADMHCSRETFKKVCDPIEVSICSNWK